jgi:hypothetical protein
MNSTSVSSDTAAEEASVGPSDGDKIEAKDDRGRRWYHPALSPAVAATSWGSTRPGGWCCCGPP